MTDSCAESKLTFCCCYSAREEHLRSWRSRDGDDQYDPLVFSVEEFLRDDEIDVVLELSMPHLAPSGVTLQDGHENRPATDWRTSTTYWLESSSHPVVQDIDKRTADLVKVPISHQESVQVLRYEHTQHYDQHLDYFSVKRHRNSADVLKRSSTATRTA